MFALGYIITFECSCGIFLLWLFLTSRKERTKRLDVTYAKSFVRGTVRGILDMFVSDEMLEKDRKLVNNKKSKF